MKQKTSIITMNRLIHGEEYRSFRWIVLFLFANSFMMVPLIIYDLFIYFTNGNIWMKPTLWYSHNIVDPLFEFSGIVFILSVLASFLLFINAISDYEKQARYFVLATAAIIWIYLYFSCRCLGDISFMRGDSISNMESRCSLTIFP